MIIATCVAALYLLAAARSIDHSTITFKNFRRSHSSRNERHPEKNENQIRRNGEREGRAEKTFALSVSSYLIFGGEHMRSRNMGRAMALAIAMTLAADAPFISIKASAAQNDGESSWEEKFRAIPKADSIKERMRTLSAEPHHVGSAADKRNAEWIRD
jgi:hypothetical protein